MSSDPTPSEQLRAIRERHEREAVSGWTQEAHFDRAILLKEVERLEADLAEMIKGFTDAMYEQQQQAARVGELEDALRQWLRVEDSEIDERQYDAAILVARRVLSPSEGKPCS